MLIKHHAVKPEFLTIRHFFEMLGIVRRALNWIEITAGNRRPGRSLGDVRISEQVEVIDFHAASSP
jgi:hypothetical protein